MFAYWNHPIRRLSLIPVLVVLAGCRSPLSRIEQSIVYQPLHELEGNYSPPGLAYEDARFSAADGTRLHGWFIPHRSPRAVVLFAHGNAGNLSHRAGLLQRLHDRHRLAVMIFDYRGYGLSEGTPSEQGVLQDARAARAWLASRAGIAERDIVLMGRSLGGAVMVDLASHDGARGLILESTFTSLPEVARHVMPLAPPRWLMKNRFDSLSKINRYNGPLLQSHGDADEVIPYALGRKLFDAAGGPKRFVTITGGGHNSSQTDEYYRALNEFIATLP